MQQQVWRDLLNRAGTAAEAARSNKSRRPVGGFSI